MTAAADQPGNLVVDLMRSRPDWFSSVLAAPERYEIQVLYAQIDRDQWNRPHFTEHAYRVDPQAYFYPASTVKLAGVLLALEKLHQLRVPGLDRNTPLCVGAATPAQTEVTRDETAPGGLPTIGHYIERVFVISDNEAYNRLYEFVGQQELNEALRRKGYHGVRLTHRLAVSLSADENRCTNPFVFHAPGDANQVVYAQPAMVSPHDYRAPGPILRGVAQVIADCLVDRPKDFASANAMSVPVLQRLLRAALFPESVSRRARFELSPGDYPFLYRAMCRLPRESRYPPYDPGHYFDGYVKFFLFGDRKHQIPSSIRLFNKVGLAYGYMTDNAYVVDRDRGVEFLLTAVISANEDGVYNDGHYEYDEIGFPFLANLGRVIYDYELTRPRLRAPDLSRFTAAWDD